MLRQVSLNYLDKEVIMQTEHLMEQAVNDLYKEIGIARIIPHQSYYNVEDKDLEIAELLARKINHEAFYNMFNAFELERIRHFIKSKREEGEYGH